VLPYVFVGLIVVGLAWYAYLFAFRRDVARRVGTIQTLSEAEQERLAKLGCWPRPGPAARRRNDMTGTIPLHLSVALDGAG
jgi:hypothetical protein